MTRRRNPHRPAKRQDAEHREQIERLQLEQLRTNFSEELDAICALEPIRSMPGLDEFLLELDRITHHGRRRLEKEHRDRVLRSIQATGSAATNITGAIDGLAELDIRQLNVLLAIFDEFKPYRRMIEKDNEFGLAQLLHDFRGVLMILNAAMKFVTGISDKPRGRGRPASQFATFTVELIGLWQLFTAVTDQDVPYHRVKRVPTPKSQNARGAKGKIQKIIKQPPTEFILHALRMIEPEIKDAEVFTAIKKARKLSDERYEFLAVNGPLRNVLKTIEAFAHYSENQARPSQTRPSSKSRMPPKNRARKINPI